VLLYHCEKRGVRTKALSFLDDESLGKLCGGSDASVARNERNVPPFHGVQSQSGLIVQLRDAHRPRRDEVARVQVDCQCPHLDTSTAPTATATTTTAATVNSTAAASTTAPNEHEGAIQYVVRGHGGERGDGHDWIVHGAAPRVPVAGENVM